MRQVPKDLRAYFEPRIERTDGCWLWKGPMGSFGYGRIGSRGAHRVIYEVLVGPVAKGLHLDHLCRVRHCVNPAHLDPVTPRENYLRGVGPAALNHNKTHCDSGHPLTPENIRIHINRFGFEGRFCIECGREFSRRHWRKKFGHDGVTQENPRGDKHRWGEHHGMAKLTADDVRAIRASTEPQKVLMTRFGVSKSCIQGIKAYRTWKYLDADREAA